MQREAVQKQGYLTKLGEKVHNWRRRYFALEGDTLTYFADSADCTTGKPKGRINVRGARVLHLDSDDYGKENCFGITPKFSQRTYVLSADSAVEREAWMKVLSHHGVLYNRRGGDAETKVDPRTIREGFLYKQGGNVKNWKRRYFALFPHTLHYYKHKGDVVPAGEIPLRAGAVVEREAELVKDKSKVQFGFSITPLLHGGGGRKYYLIADSETDMKQWMDAAKGASQLHQAEHAINTVDDQAESALAEAVESEDDDYEVKGETSQYSRRSSAASDVIDVTIIKEGWLKKKGGFVKTWKRLWFVLESTPARRMLRYFKAIEDDQPVGEIPLVPGCMVQKESESEQLVFSISLGGKRGHTCAADNAAEVENWVEAINRAIQGHTRTIPVDSPVRSQSFSAATEEKLALLAVTRTISTQFKVDPQSFKEGWLHKIMNGKSLSKKYVVLSSDSLFYFDKKPSKDTLGSNTRIPLSGAIVQEESKAAFPNLKDDIGPYTFFFSVCPSNEEKCTFATDTDVDAQAWRSALHKQIKALESESRARNDSAKEGFLNRLELSDYSWTRGYYVLPAIQQRPAVQCFKTQADAASGRPAADLELAGASIQFVPNDRYHRANCFSISGPNETWILSADTQQDMQEWVDVVMAAEEEPSSDEAEGLEWAAQ